MTAEQQIIVTYAGHQLQLNAPASVIVPLRRELDPFFQFGNTASDRRSFVAKLTVHQTTMEVDRIPAGPPTEVLIDSSLYKHMASSGERYGGDSQYAIRIRVSNTWVSFDKAAEEVQLYQPALDSCVTETTRLLKGLFTPALELGGAIQLHGSAAVGRDGCILILADMWHGKTTLLLEMLAAFDVTQLSCDTVVLSLDERADLSVTGWPSPFSVSHGTMADFPQLYACFPRERRNATYTQLWDERRKQILSSADVVKCFGTHLEARSSRIAVCLMARFAPEEPTGIHRITDPDAILCHLRRVCLGSLDPIYHNWHRFIVCDGVTIDRSLRSWSERLLQAQAYELVWGPSAVSLMKRVPALARLHKHLPLILE